MSRIKPAVTVLLAIVISVIAIVTIFTATDAVFGSANSQFLEIGDSFSSCLGGGENCELFGGGG